MTYKKYSSSSKTYFKKFGYFDGLKDTAKGIYNTVTDIPTYAWGLWNMGDLQSMQSHGIDQTIKGNYYQALQGPASNIIQNNLNNYLENNVNGWDRMMYNFQGLLSSLGMNLGSDSTFNRINAAVQNQSTEAVNKVRADYERDLADAYYKRYGRKYSDDIVDWKNRGRVQEIANEVNAKYQKASGRHQKNINQGGLFGGFYRRGIENQVGNRIFNTGYEGSYADQIRAARGAINIGNTSKSEPSYLEQYS